MCKRLIFLLAAFAAWLPVFMIQKPLFMLYHQTLAKASLTEYLQVIWHGLALDCTVAGYLTVIPFLFILLSVWLPGKFYRKILTVYFLVMAISIAAIFAVDVALYEYWGFRLDATLFFYLQSPADAMASVPVGQFLIQSAVFLVYAALIYGFLKRVIVPLFPLVPVRKRLGSTALLIPLGGLLFISIR